MTVGMIGANDFSSATLFPISDAGVLAILSVKQCCIYENAAWGQSAETRFPNLGMLQQANVVHSDIE